MSSDDENATTSNSPITVWDDVINKICEFQKNSMVPKKVNFKSIDGFGFSDNYVTSTILKMKNVDKTNAPTLLSNSGTKYFLKI